MPPANPPISHQAPLVLRPCPKHLGPGTGAKKRPEGHPKETLDPLRDTYWKVIRTPSVKFEV